MLFREGIEYTKVSHKEHKRCILSKFLIIQVLAGIKHWICAVKEIFFTPDVKLAVPKYSRP